LPHEELHLQNEIYGAFSFLNAIRKGFQMSFELTVKGDMTGDSIVVEQPHIDRGEKLFQLIREKVPVKKLVIAVSGPSGSGKSETASVLGSLFANSGFPSYVLSMDNYAIRPPRDNENYREKLFEDKGASGLNDYLGEEPEILYSRIRQIIDAFKSNSSQLDLRIIDNPANRIQEEHLTLDSSKLEVLVLEGTWSGKTTADVKVFIDKNFNETLEHRKKRARDPLTEFGEIVLSLEQQKLLAIKAQVDIVVK
jgi:uridine kinase